MSNTHNTIIHTADQAQTGGSGGEQDEPGSSCETDIPPEPTGGESGDGAEAHLPEEETNRLDVFASEECGAELPNLDWIRLKLNNALDHIEHAVTRISVRLVDDAEMTALHKRHSAINETTDVLTFISSDRDAPVEVDIAVCVDVAARRAAELNHGIERELLLYALHGILHGAGFDDHADEDYEGMHAEEDRILEAIGVGAVFRSDGESAS